MSVREIDEAVERVTRLCEQLLREVEAPQRAERLALLFESEAQLWSQLYDRTSLRLVWRAALAAEARARHNARVWRERAGKAPAAPVEMAQPHVIETGGRHVSRPDRNRATRTRIPLRLGPWHDAGEA